MRWSKGTIEFTLDDSIWTKEWITLDGERWWGIVVMLLAEGFSIFEIEGIPLGEIVVGHEEACLTISMGGVDYHIIL
jgi:hypothetical protein